MVAAFWDGGHFGDVPVTDVHIPWLGAAHSGHAGTAPLIRMSARCFWTAGCAQLRCQSPKKVQQLPRHRGHRMLLALAARCEAGVAPVQALLRLPGQFAHLCATAPLAYLQGVAYGGAVPVRSGGFHHGTPQMRVARLTDAATMNSVATRVPHGTGPE